MRLDLPFRMPLHAKGEALRSLDGKCLDQPVGSQRLDAQTGAETLDTLPMHRIDLDLRRQAKALEQPTRLHVQRMAEAVLHLQRIVRALAVVLIGPAS